MISQNIDVVNEQAVSDAFDRQSGLFDELYGSPDTLTAYKRQRVREHVAPYLNPNSRILELNAGTGEDAIYFAGNGHFVHATDASERMQKVLAHKIKQSRFEDKITYEKCSFTALQNLKNRGPYDLIFSNFAGLNCTSHLGKVLADLPSLLKPGGVVTLVLMPDFCLWEFLLLFKGKFRTAFRRLVSRNGAPANVEGVQFKCWYYQPSYVNRKMSTSFYALHAEGLCTVVPPSYLVGFAENYPKLFSYLKKQEALLKSKWPWKFIGDYTILSFIKKN